MKHFSNAFCQIIVFGLFFCFQAQAQNLVTYAGNSGKERFTDVVELSNGKVLVSGEAENLAWLPGGTPITTLTVNLAPGITSINSNDSRVAFLMLLNSTQSTIEQVVRFPAGTVASVNRIRTTNQVGSATGDMFISGMRTTASNLEDGYYIARLNNNFVGGVPTACTWYFPVSAKNKGAGPSAYKTIQPWDCGNDGSVVFGTGLDYDWDWAAIQKLDNNGNLTTVENWPYHTDTVGINTEQNYKAASAYSPGSATYSSIVLKAYRSGSLRSSVNGTPFWNGYNYNGLDENNNARKGKFPDDFFAPEADGVTPGDGRAYGRLTQGTNYNTSTVGYRTNFKSTRPTARLGGIVIDRRDNHMYFGYSTQTSFWSVTKVNGSNWVPDFEPVVVAMNNTGGLKWWARLYNQRDISLPDQYIDAVDIDYAADRLVVLARQHGFSSNMFWKGNQLFFNGGASGFKNSNSGVNTIETGHYTWIGKYDLIRVPSGPIPVQPKLYHSTFVAEYSDNPTGLGARSNDPKLDNWFLPNSGFPDLNTTKGNTRMNVSANGSVAIVATGRRTLTTADAHQKMPKPGTGSISSWNQFIRVYRPDLSSPVYSSLLTGAWDTLTGIGGSNTEIFTAFPFSNGVYVAGYHTTDATGSARPNNIPTANVPGWGNASANSESAIFGRLGFTNLSPISLSLSQNTFCSQAGNNTAAISFTPPPNFLVTFNPGNQFQAELSDSDGKFAEDGGTTTLLGSLASTSNASQSLTATFPIATPAGTGYGIRVRGTNPVTPGFWYGATIVVAAPSTPGTISGPVQVCSNASTVTPFSINKVANATTYEWEITPTVSNQLDPCDLPTCAGKITGTDTVGSVVWNPSYSGTATVRVRAVNACGVSGWQTFSVTNISPCITTSAAFNGCAGAPLTVNFSVPVGVTVAGTNQFTAELSDISGNFPGTIIGTANNVASGTGPLNRSVSATIPGGQPAGSNYRIRVNGVSGTTPSVASLASSNLSDIRNIPGVPGTPTGASTFLCLSSISGTYAYSVATVSGATNYEWRIIPDSAGTILSGTDASMTMTWNPYVGTPQIQVRAKNSCGNSGWSTALTVTISSCNTITGTTPAGPFCAGQTGISVQLSTPAGQNYSATNTFTIDILDASLATVATGLGSTTALSNSSPTFAAITGSTGTFSIPSLAPGVYSFRLRSVSGGGGGTKLGALFPVTITASSPAQPGAISGSTTPTCGQAGVAYSISAVPGASSYTWTISPATAGTITPAGASATITFASTYIAPTATLRVTANGPCSSSPPAELVITLSNTGGCAEPTPPTIPVPSANGNWRSRRTGSWFTPGTWEQHNGTSWIVPTTGFPTSASGIIQIQNGHQVTINYPVNITSTNSPAGTTQLNASATSSGVSLNGILVGNGGFSRYTTDGGTSWTAPTISGSPTDNLNSVSVFSTGQRSILVGDNGLIRLANGPAANQFWNTTYNTVTVTGGNPTTHLRSVEINSGNGLIVGEGGTVVVVSGGAGGIYDNRSSLFPGGTNLLGSYMGTNQAHVVGTGGYYRNTTAAWSSNPTWNTALTIGGGAVLNDISINGTNNGIIVGNGGVILRSTNASNAAPTWNSVTSPTTENLLSVRHGNGSEAFAVGANGTILYTANDGQNWTIISGITTETIRDVFPSNSADKLCGFMVGANGLLVGGVQIGNGSSFGNIDQVVVENGATLILGYRDFNPQNGAGVDLDVAGILDIKESGSATTWAASTQAVFRSSALYRHGRNGGSTSRDLLGAVSGSTVATFLPGSTVEVYGVTNSSPNLRSLLYANFTWNSTGQTSALSFNNPPLVVLGTFRVQSTGTSTLTHQSANPATTTIQYPNFQLDAGTFYLQNGNNNTTRITLNVGNLTVNGGVFNPIQDQGQATINVSGTFSQSAGTINSAASGSQLKGVRWNFLGNFAQTGGTFTQTLTSVSPVPYTQSPVIFNGSGNQNIQVGGTFSGNLDLQIQKPSGILQLTGNANFGSVATKWISGDVQTNAFTLTTGPLSLRGAANTVFGTLSGTGGWNTNALSVVSGRLNNTADNLIVTNPSSFTAISGGDRNNYVIGGLRKVFGVGASGGMTFPIGTTTGFKPMTIQGFTNDATQKTLSFSVAGTGANQASGTKIQNVGSQPVIGGVNWRIRRTDAPTGSVTALASVKVTNDTLTTDQRLGQTNTNLTSGFASVGGNVTKNSTYSVSTARYYDFVSTKPLDLSGLAGSTGTWFAVGGPSTVTPPGGGYSVGPTGNFPNLTSVAAEYNDVRFTAPAIFTFQSTYEGRADNGGTEVFPVTFFQNQTQPVTIRYQGSSVIETSNTGVPSSNAILVLDGADNITFEGNDKWRFLNKGTGSNASALRFQNGAQQNNFKHMILEGSDETSTYTGTVYFAGSPSIGNSNNSIESCRISSNADRRLEPIVIGISNNLMPGLGYGSIVNASNTTPITITTGVNHGFVTGQDILIEGVHGNYAANGNWQITVTGPRTFQLDGSTGNGDFRVSYFVNALTATNPVTVRTANQLGAIIDHNIPIGAIQPVAGPGLQGSGLTYAATNSNGDYYAKAISSDELEIYRDPAATNPLILTAGTYTPGTGSINFHTDARLWKEQAGPPALATAWRTFGNGSVFLFVTNVTKLGSGLIEVTTSANHNMISGWAVRLADVDGTGGNFETEINRYTGWQIDVTASDRFTLRNSNGANGGTDVTGSYVSGGRFLVSPMVVSSNNHGLLSGNPVSINGVQGVYSSNGTHYARRLDNNAFSIWENASGADSTKPRYPSYPGVISFGNTPGALLGGTGFTGTPVFSRPGIPMISGSSPQAITNCTYLNNTPIAGQVTYYFTVANGTFGANAIGQRFYCVTAGIGGFGGISPNQEFQGNPFAIVSATNQFTVTLTGTATGSYTSGGTFYTRITIGSITPTQYGCNGSILDTWQPSGCGGEGSYLPAVNFSKNSGLRVGDEFTISGITGPESGHGFNGTFRSLSPGYQGNGGSVQFSCQQRPTTAPIINTGGVPNMTADPNPPFNGQVVAAYDILATRCVYSQNSGNSLNSGNRIIDNEISQFDEVAVSVTSLGNGGDWEITGNSIFNKFSQPPAVGAANFQGINFVPGLKSNNNVISNNFIGGQEAGASGNAMVFSRGISLESFNINVGNEVPTLVENNLIRNINAISFSGSVGAVQGFNLQGGRIELKNNTMGGTEAAAAEDTIRVGGTGAAPTYLVRSTGTDSVTISGNSFAHIQMPGSVDHNVTIGIENAQKVLIKNNKMHHLSADYSFFDRTLTFVRFGPRLSATLNGSTNGTITWNSHGFSVGDYVRIESLTGNTSANGNWRISSVPNTNQFVLEGYSGSGSSGTNTGTGIRIPSRIGMSATVDSNEVYNIRINNGGSGMSTLTMVLVGAAEAKGIISRNRIYNNTTLRQGNFVTLWGPTNQGTGWWMVNNQASIVGAGNSFSPRCHGFLNEVPHNPGQLGSTLPKIYFNTVWLRNNSGNANSILYGYRKNSSGRAVVRNNIFFVSASTNPGGVSYSTGVNNTLNWQGSDFTHNLLYAEGSNAFLALWNTTPISTISNWQGFAGAGSVENLFNYANFEEVQPAANGNLALSTDNCPIKDKGINVAYRADFDSLLVRDVSRPDLGSNEFSRNLPTGAFWIGAVNNDWNTDANWCDQRVPLAEEDVTITNAPAKPFMPIISTPDAVCRNLNIANNSGSMLVIYGENAALTVSGKTPQIRFAHDNLSNINGSVRFVTDSAQNIPGNATELSFQGKNILRGRPRISNLTYTNNPDVITVTTTAAHGLVLGDQVLLTNVRGASVPARPLKVTSVSGTSFTLAGFASGTYTPGTGTVIPLAMIPINAMANGPSVITVTTARIHNLEVGQMVAIAGSKGNVKANGSWEVASIPTTTTFTINVISTDAFVFDTSAYAFPGRTGYFDVYVDGESDKEATGLIETVRLTVSGGNLALPTGQGSLSNTLIRDSLIVNGNRNVSFGGANYRIGHLINKGGTLTFPTANLQVNDSLTSRGGSITVSAGAVTTRNLAVLEGGNLDLGSGTTTVSDSVMVFGGTIEKSAGNIEVGRRLNLRSGIITLGGGGSLNLNNPTASIVGGSETSYVDGKIAQVVNTLSGQTGTSTPITTVANATPVRMTRTNHGLQTGDRIRVTGTTPAALNGNWSVIRIDANNFDLVSSTAQGAGSGGNFTRFGQGISGGTSSGTPIVVTHNAHGLSNGDVVQIRDNAANSNANGIWTVRSATANTFELDGTLGNGSSSSGANDGTFIRLETKVFPVGKAGAYRPTQLHLAQGNTTAKQYTAEFQQAAPQILNMPVNLPMYGAPGVESVSTVALNSYHTITQSAPAVNIDAGSVTLSYGTAENVTVNNRRGITIVKDSVPHDTWLHLYATSIDSVSSTKLIRSTRPFYSFSDFTLGYLIDVPLPLTLIRFKANLVKNGVSSNWTTAHEQKMESLVLERSIDGRFFQTISTQKPKGLNGGLSQYQYLDEQAFNLGVGKLYYRLRLVDQDGAESFSQTEVVLLNQQALQDMTLYPQPFDKDLVIGIALEASETVELNLTDVLGKSLWKKSLVLEKGFTESVLNLNELAKGTYLLQVKTQAGSAVRKVVKQ